MEFEEEVSVKDIVNFYIKINDASKAKKDIAQLSAKDKATAFEVIVGSAASRNFKVEVAKYFIYDLDARVRRKAELMMEDLVPGWVSDPAESILKLLKSAGSKGASPRNSAVKFLFGIVDANSLRDTFMTLLNSRNRAHMTDILAIMEEYIDTSVDQQEQVKIFDACLDIVLSDDAEQIIKFHASNLLGVFFKKVEATKLGETLRQKFIERQVEKAEGVYRYLCSGASGLNGAFLEDLLRPLNVGGKVYQLKILAYFSFILEKAGNPAEVDTALDTYPDYWNQNELPKEEKVRSICRRIMQGLEELWDNADDNEVREQIIRIKFNEYANKRELLEQIKGRVEGGETLSDAARDKIALMLRCFLSSGEDDALKLQAAHLLLFRMSEARQRLAALEYLKSYIENRNLNYAERGSIATVMDSLLGGGGVTDALRDMARYILFLAAPDRFGTEAQQREILKYLRGVIEGEGLSNVAAEERVLQALAAIEALVVPENLRKAVQYLVFKIRNPQK